MHDLSKISDYRPPTTDTMAAVADDKVTVGMNLMRRLPPADVVRNLEAVQSLIDDEDAAEELLGRVDQPLTVAMDEEAKRSFLVCDYNRDGDSFRYVIDVSFLPRTVRIQADVSLIIWAF